jgi:hypothetical protein
MELLHFVKGLDPVADAFAGTVVSDVVNMSGYGTCIFTIVKGVGATGTSTVTVLACDDVVPTNSAAVPFMYRAITTGDTEGALTAAAAAGFATTAGSSQRYIIEVDDLALAASGYKYVQLKMVELVDDPVLGGIEIMMTHARFAQAVKATAIV